MKETEIVMAIDEGRSEDDVICEAGISFDQLDEIMEAHGFKRVDGEWITQ